MRLEEDKKTGGGYLVLEGWVEIAVALLAVACPIAFVIGLVLLW